MRGDIKTRPAPRQVQHVRPQRIQRRRVRRDGSGPARFNDDGQPTLAGFRADERWMVREYGD